MHKTDYQNFIYEVFNKPDEIVYDSINKEYLYIKGADLLRIGEARKFISLYHGVQSDRVVKTIMNGSGI